MVAICKNCHHFMKVHNKDGCWEIINGRYTCTCKQGQMRIEKIYMIKPEKLPDDRYKLHSNRFIELVIRSLDWILFVNMQIMSQVAKLSIYLREKK